MDENPPIHPGVPDEAYHKLGPKTLWIMVLSRIHASIILLFLSIVLFAVNSANALTNTPAPIHALIPYILPAAWIVLGLFVVIFGLTFFFSWLMYINYKFALGDNALKIKRGILDKEEVAIPYRQIQDVDLKRDLSFQMMGLSRIVILTAGHDDAADKDDQTEGILPALDRNLAEWLQAQLLDRSNVQKVVETK